MAIRNDDSPNALAFARWLWIAMAIANRNLLPADKCQSPNQWHGSGILQLLQFAALFLFCHLYVNDHVAEVVVSVSGKLAHNMDTCQKAEIIFHSTISFSRHSVAKMWTALSRSFNLSHLLWQGETKKKNNLGHNFSPSMQISLSTLMEFKPMTASNQSILITPTLSMARDQCFECA